MEVKKLLWKVKYFFPNRGGPCSYEAEEKKFESGETLDLPCSWRFRFLNQAPIYGGPTSVMYEMRLELVDCPWNKTSVFAGFEIVVCDDVGNELGRSVIEKREWVKAQLNAVYLKMSYTSRTQLELKIRFVTFSTDSSIQNMKQAKMKESLMLFENKLKMTLGDLLEQKDNFSDFKIKMKDTGNEFPVHRAILAPPSPVFRTMFHSGMIEASTGEMEIKDLSTEVMEMILKFIYSGTMSEEWTDVIQELIYAGDKYEVKILTEFCDTMLVHICTLENALDLLKLARQFKLETAEKDIMTWMLQNIKYEDVLKNYVLEKRS